MSGHQRSILQCVEPSRINECLIDGMNAALSQRGFVRGAEATLERCWVPPEPDGIYVPEWKCHDHLGTERPS